MNDDVIVIEVDNTEIDERLDNLETEVAELSTEMRAVKTLLIRILGGGDG